MIIHMIHNYIQIIGVLPRNTLIVKLGYGGRQRVSSHKNTLRRCLHR